MTETLLMTGREAARMLAICERTLYTLSKAGEIPTVRIGRAVRYDRRDLHTFCEKMKRAS